MTITPDQTAWFAQTFEQLAGNVSRVVLGKHDVARLAVTCLLSEGHLLLEDVPGTGKTSLARALANTVQGTQSRIQFTPDMLPSDVTGVSVYDQRTQQFEFRRGPVFNNIVVADEINRASPKTQSALLEVMEEGRVTVDGQTRPVERPFMVIATQNPIEHAGTYPLPEAQLDRFLMKTSVGYPDHEATVALLADAAVRDRAARAPQLITASVVATMSSLADQVHVDPAVLSYVSRLAEETRRHRHVTLGLSVRGCLAYVRCAKTWALSTGREYVLPDDIKQLAHPILAHRLLVDPDADFAGVQVDGIIDDVLAAVAAPAMRAA
jgi:MoxR-like ATPase